MIGSSTRPASPPTGRHAILADVGADSSAEAWSIARLLNWSRGWLAAKGVEHPRLSAELLLAHAVGCERIELYTRFDRVADPSQLDRFRALLRQAAEHAPIAYLVGKKEFYSLEFEVTPAVLIPRPESETLVERVADYCRSVSRDVLHVWDLGTGSGCLAVALCKQLPNIRCLATDISADALEVAARNVARHGLAERIKLACADGLAVNPDLAPPAGFDVLMSNPPYVADDELAKLDATVREYEPSVALRAGPDGLPFYRAIAEGAPRWLRTDGAVFVEIGYGKQKAVEQIVTGTGAFEHAGTWPDAPASHERVMKFTCRRGVQAPAPT